MALRNFFRRSDTRDSESDAATLKEHEAATRAAGEKSPEPEPTPTEVEMKAEEPAREPTSTKAEAEQPEPAPAEQQGEDSSSASGGAEATVGSGSQVHDDTGSDEDPGGGVNVGDGDMGQGGAESEGGDVVVGDGSSDSELPVPDEEAGIDDSADHSGQEPDHSDGHAQDDNHVDVVIDVDAEHEGQPADESPLRPDVDLQIQPDPEPQLVEARPSVEVDLEPDFAVPTLADDTVPSWTDPPENGPDEHAESFEPVFTGEFDQEEAQPFVPDVHLPDPEQPIQLPDIEPIDG